MFVDLLKCAWKRRKKICAWKRRNTVVYDVALKQFKSSENRTSEGYPLNDFIDDFFKLDIIILRQKLSDLVDIVLDSQGYIVYQEQKLPIRDLAFFANKQRSMPMSYNMVESEVIG